MASSYDSDPGIADYRLVHLQQGRTLMVRRLRACDAERYNLNWRAAGIPTRWEPLVSAAVA